MHHRLDTTAIRGWSGPVRTLAHCARGLGLALCLGLLLPLAIPASASAQDDGFGPPAPPATRGAKITLIDSDFDWGEVIQGEVIEHTYRFRNDGDAPLRITQVKPG